MKQPEPGGPEDFDTVIALFEAGQTEKAAALCSRLLARTPDDIPLMNMLGVIAAQEGRFEEAAGHFRGVIRKAPDDPGVITNLAQALFECGQHQQAHTLFLRVLPAGSNLRILRSSDISEVATHAGAAQVYSLENVTLDTGYWAIIDGEKFFARDLSNLNMINSPTIKGRITADRVYAAVAIPKVERSINTPCIFVGGDGNYAHWLYRYLMRLAALDNRPDIASLPLVIGENRRYQTEALAVMGFGENEVISLPVNSAVDCREIHVPVCLWSTRECMELGIKWLRDRTFENIDKPDVSSGRRIFVSRRDAPSRHMSNEPEVIDALIPFGLETVELSRLSFTEQVSLFSECELVVAPHGAGLANLIFAPTGCRVVELVSDPIAHMADIRQIQQILDQPGIVVPSRSYKIDPGATKPMVQHTFQTDPKKVVDAVERLLNMAG